MPRLRNTVAAAVLAACLTSAVAGEEEKRARRLESITWNPVDHKLTWVVSDGAMNGQGKFEGTKKLTYEIDMDEATMNANGEDRRFAKAEAVSVHKLMDLVSKYAAESTVWWEQGQGEPLDKNNSQKLRRDSHEHDEHTIKPERPRTRPDPRDAKIIRITYER